MFSVGYTFEILKSLKCLSFLFEIACNEFIARQVK